MKQDREAKDIQEAWVRRPQVEKTHWLLHYGMQKEMNGTWEGRRRSVQWGGGMVTKIAENIQIECSPSGTTWSK